ncbi:MAG TPA: ATP-binding protein [Thermoanaerobaculia bacterium]|nr:ATP-binding protein [Thermoanaerobaculia bacterium]
MTRPRPSFQSIVIAVLTLAVIAGGFHSFQRKRSSFERLDFQSFRDNGTIVIHAVDPGSGAEKAGLRAGDLLWAVNGIPAGEVDAFRETMRGDGRPVSLIIGRGNDTLQILYRAPELKIEYTYLFFTFTGFLYLSIGLFTLFRGARGESLLFYFVTLLTFVVYAYSPDNSRVDLTYQILYLVEELARIILPPLTLHFFLRFPRPLLQNRLQVSALYFLPSLLILWNINLFLLGNAIPIASPATSIQIIERWEMLHFAVYFTLAFIALAYSYRTASVVGQRKQVKWILLGMGVGFIPFLFLYLIPYIVKGVDSAYTSIAIIPLALIPLAFAVSILRYRLWDVEVIIKEILAYTVTFVFGIIAFSTVNLVLSTWIEEHFALERNFLAFTSGLLIAGVLVPVKGRIESIIEMFVYRDTYRHRKAILDFAQELATFHDLHELIEMVRERVAAAINVHQMNLYVRDGGYFVVYTREPRLPMRFIESEIGNLPQDRPLLLDQPRLPEASEIPMVLLREGYRYLFPLRHRGELQGILLVGNKGEQEPLSRDDIYLIGSLTSSVALAIENARLYGRLRRQLDEIRTLKEYNENIIESSSSAIVVISADGTVLTGNNAFWTLVGTGPESEETIEQLFPPFRRLEGSGGAALEVHFTNRLGEERELTISSSPFNASGAPAGTSVLVIGDISERVRLERELQDKDRLAALGLLAAGVAHEVNTPLTGISSYAQLLLADLPADDPRYDILRKMEQQTFRASHLVNNLLNFARTRSGSMETVDMADMVHNTLSVNENLLNTRDLTVHVGELPHLKVLGDVYQLQQVLTNLLLNARDAAGQGGNVWIGLEAVNDRAVLTVRDDGGGVDPELRDTIFQPLVTTKRGQGGTGLGLAISDRIVRSHGGEITLESESGQGATFSVSLPLWMGNRGDN